MESSYEKSGKLISASDSKVVIETGNGNEEFTVIGDKLKTYMTFLTKGIGREVKFNVKNGMLVYCQFLDVKKGVSMPQPIAQPHTPLESKPEGQVFPKQDQQYWDNRNQSIIRQSCLKCSCEYLSGVLPSKEIKDNVELEKQSKLVLDLAELFVKWVNQEGVKK